MKGQSTMDFLKGLKAVRQLNELVSQTECEINQSEELPDKDLYPDLYASRVEHNKITAGFDARHQDFKRRGLI